MALSYQHPPIVIAPNLLTYRVNTDALTAPGVGAQYHMNFIAGDALPGMITDSIIGPLQTYFNDLMSSYFPGDMAGMLTAITIGTDVGIYVRGSAASILTTQWVLDTVGPNTALSLKVDVDTVVGSSALYADVTIFSNVQVQDPITEVTTIGAALLAKQNIGHLAFVPTHFAVGDYGYDPLIPQHPLPVDATDTALTHEIYRAPIERFDAPTDGTLAVVCRVPSSSLRCAVGEVGVFVTLTSVTNNTPIVPGGPILNVGDTFLFGLTHMAMRCLTHDQSDLHAMTFAL